MMMCVNISMNDMAAAGVVTAPAAGTTLHRRIVMASKSTAAGASEQTVNSTDVGQQLNRSGMSEQQRAMLEAIALASPDKRGRYYPYDIFDKVGKTGTRSEPASLSRALVRLERRGLIERHHYYTRGHAYGGYVVVLTEPGCALVNQVRAGHGLPPLTFLPYDPRPRRNAEEVAQEFRRHWQEVEDRLALDTVKALARRLSPARLEELRRWIEAKQAGQDG